LPYRTDEVVNPHKTPVLWLGTAERISEIVETNHPGVWIMGDLDHDDCFHQQLHMDYGFTTIFDYRQ
jgi:hypothetical protein